MTDPEKTRYLLVLTPTQRMALMDIIVGAMIGPVQVQVYVDVLRGLETRPYELLDLVIDAVQHITPTTGEPDAEQ